MKEHREIKEILQNKGYKYTKQRESVYEIFVENRNVHMTTEEVYLEALKVMPEIGIATIYRTVLVLEELGLISAITFEDGITRYELKKEDDAHTHHHLVCTQCNKIIEVNVDLLESLEEQIEEKESFKITDHNLKFYGVCCDCRQESEGTKNEKQ
ncbi:transcriptional repressor [Peptoniphilus sp. KCTC 25270]|uniref:Fur family transcriptional regulator n=1 Tax=Peptoniphilus sp. KCTC 25270 TaxID=2897414 RepID=UPI001E2861DE|nr:Fur family transcriptional regulator [Peptoniphilus sp. KCTC 25270]MCD1147172.1 transcriptional repressor [Peptoniphilus sp. KCTC 25270]